MRYHPEAEAEIVRAARYYEKRVEGLGARFLSEFEATATRILEAPERWRLLEGDVRRCLMRRFPYGIYYRVDTDEVRILVVKHHSRHPDYWKERVTE